MYWKNETTVIEFLLVGFKTLHSYKILVFFLILTVYSVTMTGSFLIIAAVLANPRFQSPMYFFLCNLFLSDTVLTTCVIPKMLCVIWKEGTTISFGECLFQFCVYSTSGGADCLILTVMSYDRYLAICNPLRYTSIMDHMLCLHLIVWSWFLCLIISVVSVIMIYQLRFCNSSAIDHFFCDLGPLLQISCSETYFAELHMIIASIPVIVLPFLFIIRSYFCISITILKMPSITGRQKAFSTCSSHLIIVCAFYGTMITLYIVPSKGHSTDINKFLSLLYTLVTPLLNPVIYGLRSEDIRKALRKLIF